MSQLINLSEKKPLNLKKSVDQLLTLNQHKIRLGLSRINKVIKKLKIYQRGKESKQYNVYLTFLKRY